MPCSVSGGGQAGSPGLLVVTRSELDTSPRPPGTRRWSPGQQTDREFFRLSNRLQDNRKVETKLSSVRLRRNNTFCISVFFHL